MQFIDAVAVNGPDALVAAKFKVAHPDLAPDFDVVLAVADCVKRRKAQGKILDLTKIVESAQLGE